MNNIFKVENVNNCVEIAEMDAYGEEEQASGWVPLF